MGLNMLEYNASKPELKTFVVDEVYGIFRKLYSDIPDAFGPMFEQYYRNATQLVVEDPEGRDGRTILFDLLGDIYALDPDERKRPNSVESTDLQARELIHAAGGLPLGIFGGGDQLVGDGADMPLSAALAHEITQPLGAIDRSKLNVNGSSLAAGHPFAATGARIVATLAKLLAHQGSGRGLISICAAGGQGVVAILER